MDIHRKGKGKCAHFVLGLLVNVSKRLKANLDFATTLDVRIADESSQ